MSYPTLNHYVYRVPCTLSGESYVGQTETHAKMREAWVKREAHQAPEVTP